MSGKYFPNLRPKPKFHFPMLWLTYRGRIEHEMAQAFSSPDAKVLFDEKYQSRLSDQTKQIDERLQKLMTLQVAILAFQIVGFLNSDVSVSIFGVTLKNAAGVKEVLLGLSTTIGVVVWFLSLSRDTMIVVSEIILERSTDKKLLPFAKLAAPSMFGFKIYGASLYDRYIFPTRLNMVLLTILGVLVVLTVLAFIAFQLVVSVYFFMDIYKHPTLGIWSTCLLMYVAVATLMTVLFIARIAIPLPYRDHSVLQELAALEKAGKTQAHKELLKSVFY